MPPTGRHDCQDPHVQGQLQGRLLTPSAAALAAAALIWAVRQHLEEEGVQEEEEELGLRRPRRAHELSEDLLGVSGKGLTNSALY